MGLSTTQKKVILILAGFIILLVSFFFIFQKNNDKVTRMQDEIREHQRSVDFLSSLQIQVNQLREEIPDQEEAINNFAQTFPCKMTSALALSNIDQMMVKSGVEVTAISLKTELPFFKEGQIISLDSEDAKTMEEEASDGKVRILKGVEAEPEKKVEFNLMQGNALNIEIELIGSRNQIMKAIDWIAKNKEQMSVNNITLTHDDSTGKLAGTLGVYFYSMNGNGRQYEAPNISGITIGSDDVFGTFK